MLTHAAGASGSVIMIDKTNPDFCNYCIYYIRILCDDLDLKGYFSVHSSSDSIWLQDGKQILDDLGPGEVN